MQKPPHCPGQNNEVTWKYASQEKADAFRKKYPELKATNQEIEDAAYKVYLNEKNGFNNLEKAWEDPKFQELMQKHILKQQVTKKLKSNVDNFETNLL